MRLGYLLSEYPTPGHRFMRREIEGLSARGLELAVASIRRPRSPLTPGSDDERAMRGVFYVAHASWTHVAAAHVRLLVRHPLRLARGLAAALALGHWHPRHTLAALCYLAEAVVAGHWFTRQGVRHVHVHFASTVGLLLTRMFPLSMSITLHGPDEFESPAAFRLAQKVSASRFVVAISHFARSQVMRYAPARTWDRIEVVPLGVEVSRLAMAPPPPGGGIIRLVYAGRLAAVKGLPVLLEAMTQVAAAWPQVVLHLAGDGPDRGALEARVRALGLSGHVIFEGLLDQPRLHALYRSAHAFVLPTFAEGVPVVLMEAMALGVPCISTSVNGVPELITSGESGLLVPAGDAQTLARAMARLIEDDALCARIAAGGRAAVEARYDITRNVERLAEVFATHLGDLVTSATRGPSQDPLAAGAAKRQRTTVVRNSRVSDA